MYLTVSPCCIEYSRLVRKNQEDKGEREMTNIKVGHIGLNITNLANSIAFYQDIFGLTVKGASMEGEDKFAFLGNDQGIMITLWQQSEGRFDSKRPGLHHLAFQVDTIEEVKTYEQKLNEKKVKYIYDGIVTHREGAQSGGIFFEDPDGTRLEIFSPTGADEHGHAASGEKPSCGFF
jgi:lactoylglutathione lyase